MKQSMIGRARRLGVATTVSLTLMLAAVGCGGGPDPAVSGPTGVAEPVTTTPPVAAPAPAPEVGSAAAPAPAGGPATGVPTSVAPSPAAATTAQPSAGSEAGVHFTTPQAA